MPDNNNSSASTIWNSKYHTLFSPGYRRKIFCGEYKAEISKYLETLPVSEPYRRIRKSIGYAALGKMKVDT